jgi:Mn-dependent DtxR family transcriptional regulator
MNKYKNTFLLFSILTTIYERRWRRNSSTCLTDISKKVGVGLPTISLAVCYLTRKGYIKSKTNGRSKKIILTELGGKAAKVRLRYDNVLRGLI